MPSRGAREVKGSVLEGVVKGSVLGIDNSADAARRWKEADLAKRAKGDLGKVKIAWRLRAETLVTVKWMAGRLGIGTASYVNNRLYRWRKGMLK